MKKISITGTKGKTTVTNILAEVLRESEKKVLHVNTNGAYINGVSVLTKKQSQAIWDIVPTVSPGRFLYLLIDSPSKLPEGANHDSIEGVAVLESALGSGTLTGLGYHAHDVGVFTNVFEDHLGSRADLKTREDIGRSKSFVFSRIKKNGYAVFNADDDIVTANLTHCKAGVHLVPFGLTFAHFDLAAHLAGGGDALTVRDGRVVHLSGKKEQALFAIADVIWTFNGKFTPSVYNLLAVTGALFGYSEGTISDALIEALVRSRLEPEEGRLVLFRNKNNVTILADYAHEKQSLASVATLAGQLKAAPANKTIGVLRLAWDRTDQLIDETAAHIASSYDTFIIYDKIDGYWRQPERRNRTGKSKFTQEIGKISESFANALQRYAGRRPVERITREDLAIEQAAAVAQPGDVVVVIVNDDIARSLNFVKQSFKAELV